MHVMFSPFPSQSFVSFLDAAGAEIVTEMILYYRIQNSSQSGFLGAFQRFIMRHKNFKFQLSVEENGHGNSKVNNTNGGEICPQRRRKGTHTHTVGVVSISLCKVSVYRHNLRILPRP